ncbi:MAG: ABC transporter ATP-binding protein [Bacilli bacterium]|jgi:ATP-binding cassette subfamily B protein|nr:ABC transporter ATP-binding protein [Bacilli bacterium]
MILLKHFRHYYLKYALAFLFGVVILVVIDWYQLEIPRIVKTIIDGVENESINHLNQIFEPLLTVVLIVVGITIGRFLWRLLLFGTGRKIETDIRQEMFTHATTLDQNFYSKQKIGGLMSYFINDLNAVRELFGFGLLMIIDGLVLGIFVLVRMFSLDWVMTLYAFIPIALMGVLVFFLELKMEQKFKLRQEAFESTSDFAQESFTGITVIKAYVREVAESLGFRKKSQEVYQKSMDHMRYAIIVNIIIDAMISVVIIAIIAFGSIMIAQGNLSSGELTEYIAYFFTLLWPVFAISWFLNINGQAQASAKRIYAFLESKAIVNEHPDAIKDATLDGSITFNHLSFTYPDAEEPILKDISFSIKAGEMVGVLGKTGSGKSTLVELLLHVYNVEENMIKYGDYDHAKLSLKTLRNHIGYVPQDNFLFSETIKDNIGFAFSEIEEEKLEEVGKLSDIHEDVMSFKEQYQTILGERGVTVSGGQKQRISIARALAKDPTILILDDSVSAVDTKTEEDIIHNLRRVRKGKTTLMIAHRISTVRHLDKIVLIDQGRLTGFGTHAELLKSNSLYKEMYNLQKLEELVGEEEVYA